MIYGQSKIPRIQLRTAFKNTYCTNVSNTSRYIRKNVSLWIFFLMMTLILVVSYISSKTEEPCLLLTVTAITNGFVAAPFYEN